MTQLGRCLQSINRISVGMTQMHPKRPDRKQSLLPQDLLKVSRSGLD